MIKTLALLVGVLFVLGYVATLGVTYWAYLRSHEPTIPEVIVGPPLVGTLVYAFALVHPIDSVRAVVDYA